MAYPAAMSKVPVGLNVTPFQLRVYDATRRIPRGRVTTYGLLAQALGCGSARAIGQALKVNPWAPRVPCHRVIRADLTLGGFQGRTSGAALRRKAELLRREGVRLVGGHLADPRFVFRLERAPGRKRRADD